MKRTGQVAMSDAACRGAEVFVVDLDCHASGHLTAGAPIKAGDMLTTREDEGHEYMYPTGERWER